MLFISSNNRIRINRHSAVAATKPPILGIKQKPTSNSEFTRRSVKKQSSIKFHNFHPSTKSSILLQTCSLKEKKKFEFSSLCANMSSLCANMSSLADADLFRPKKTFTKVSN